MKALSFVYQDNNIINDKRLNDSQQMLKATIKTIEQDRECDLNSRYASLFMLSNQEMLNEIKSLVAQKKELRPDVLVIIGIGGSNLGTWAVHDALGKPGIPVYYADTIDPEKIAGMLQAVEAALKERKNVLLTIISKSGSTTETIINGSLFIALLKRYRPNDYRSFIVVITENASKLWAIAKQESWSTLAVPHHVSGRFSVFSAVGLFPLGILDVDLDELIAGAVAMRDDCLTYEEDNVAVTSASLLYAAYHSGYVIHDFFTFAAALLNVGMWYRQLLAESIGKEFTVDGKRVLIGMTPTVSVGSTDLHSMVELHLGGQHNTFTTFVDVEKKDSLIIPDEVITKELIPYVVRRSLAEVMKALFEGTQRAYKKKGLPFAALTVPETSAFYIGQLLQWKMMEIIFLGALFEVNPFEQPQVELYKREVKAILDHE